MSNSFVSKVLGRKKRRRIAVQASVIAAIIAVFLALCLHIGNIFLLSSIFEKSISNVKDNPNYSITYTKKYNFLRSALRVKDIKIAVNSGEMHVGSVYITKKSGFIIPDVVSAELNDIEVKSISGKSYNVIAGKNIKINAFFNKHFFEKPDFGGLAIDEPLQLSLIDGRSIETGNVKIDELDVRFNKDEKKEYFRSSGMIMINDGDVSPVIFIANRPFKWDFDIREVYEDKKWGINKERTETIYTTKIEKFIFDNDFTSIKMNGFFVRGVQLKQSDMFIEIENYNKLLENIFNMSAKNEQSNTDLLKKMYRVMKNDVVPMLKKKQSNQAKNVLSMNVKRGEFDEEASVNGIPMSTIFKKLTSVK